MSQEARNRRRKELYSQRMAAETPEAREERLAIRRVRDQAHRDAETPEAREARLAARKFTARAHRDASRERARAQSRRAQETPADRDHCLAAE